MINREIGRRAPTMEATREIPIPTQAPRRRSAGQHEGERDREAALGCVGIIMITLTFLACVAAVLVRTWADCVEYGIAAKPMDGSTAGSNAVTVEELLTRESRGERDDGDWSAPREDLGRE